MNDVKTVALGDVVNIVGGGTPSKNEKSFWNGSIPWASVRDLKNRKLAKTEFSITEQGLKSCSTNVIAKGNVVIASRVGLGKVVQLEVDAAINQDLRGLIPKNPSSISSDFLYYWSKFVSKQIVAAGSGATVQGVRLDFLRSLRFPLIPVDQQDAIVRQLDSVFSLVDNQNLAMAHEKNLAKDLAKSILAEKLTHVERARVTSLKEIATLSGRIGWKGLTAKEYVKEGPRFLSVHSLNYGHFVDFRDAFNITQERYDESPEIMLQENDILICKDGAGIGKLGLVPRLLGPTTINSSLLLIRPHPEVFHEYLYLYLLSPMFQSIVQERLSGSTTPHLYQRDIAELKVLLPALDEQKKLVEQIWTAFAEQEKVQELASKKTEVLEQLRHAFLVREFSRG
jgi:type I restriction enzyme S subunit